MTPLTELKIPDKYRRTLTDEEKEAFAFEVALGYFEPEELRHVFKLSAEGYRNYMDSESMKTRIVHMHRRIDESPQALRIHARRAARIAIDELASLVKDPDAPAKTRMAAGQQLREYAFVVDKDAVKQTSDDEGAVIIRTNLDMGDARGVYTITAEEVAEQVGDESEEDFSELLGLT